MAISVESRPQTSHVTPEDVQIVDVHGLQDEVGLTTSRFQIREKIEKFAGLVDQAVSEAQEAGVIEVVANADPSLTIQATGLSAASVNEVRVLDGRSENVLTFGRAGRIEHGGEEAGVIEVSLGESLTTGNITVTTLEATASDDVAEEAMVPVSLMNTKSFIPSPENMPTIKFVGDTERLVNESEAIKIGPNFPSIAALAASVRLFRGRGHNAGGDGAIEVESGYNGLNRVIAPSTGRSAGKLALGELAF